MKRKVLAVAATSAVALAVIAAAPASSGSSSPAGLIDTAQAAAVSKSGGGGGGGGNVTDAGNRLGELLTGWAVPVIIVLAGCLLVGALASRNIGTSVGIVVISMMGLIFLLAPESIESFAKGIAHFVF